MNLSPKSFQILTPDRYNIQCSYQNILQKQHLSQNQLNKVTNTVKLPPYLDHIMQSNDIRMINISQNINLRHQTLFQLFIQFPCKNLLNRNFGTMNLMPRMPNHRKRSRTKLFPYNIIPNRSTSIRRLSHQINKQKTLVFGLGVELNRIRRSATVVVITCMCVQRI